jgi:hypothetical protein
MPGNISISAIEKSALDGVVKAQKACEQWTGGCWLWEAHESLVSIFVAQELAAMKGAKYVTIEHKLKSAMKDAGAIGRGKLPYAIRPDGRIDILLWWANGTPRAPIEVKCQVVSIRKIKADLLRINKVLAHNKEKSTFQFGLLVFYSAFQDCKGISAREVAKEHLENIEEDCEKWAADCSAKMTHSKIHEDGDSAWVASVVVLKPN